MSLTGYTISFYFISYLLFFALLWLSKGKRGNRLLDKNGPVSNRGLLIGLHIGGIILFGVVPFLSNNSPSPLFGKSLETMPTGFTVLLIILLIIIAPQIAKTKFREILPDPSDNISLGIVFTAAYFFIRILFICAYESWFRGYLLNDCIIIFSEPLAVLLNVSLYTLLHWVNGKEEVLACIPFGLFLCGLCIWQGAVWPAVAIHLALTIPYEIICVQKIKKQYENFSNRSIGLHRQ